jgi:hypothetical protein
MSLRRRREPWFTPDLKQAMFATPALGLDPWFMDAAAAGLNNYFPPRTQPPYRVSSVYSAGDP